MSPPRHPSKRKRSKLPDVGQLRAVDAAPSTEPPPDPASPDPASSTMPAPLIGPPEAGELMPTATEEGRRSPVRVGRLSLNDGPVTPMNRQQGKRPAVDADQEAALLDVESDVADLRQLIAKSGALTFAVEDLFTKILWDDRSDERDEDRRLEHLAHLIDATKETVGAAVDMGEDISAELIRSRVRAQRARSRM